MSASTAQLAVVDRSAEDAEWDMLDAGRDPFENEMSEDRADIDWVSGIDWEAEDDGIDWEAERRYLWRITSPIIADNARRFL